MEDQNQDFEAADLRFSFLRFMGFLTITCVAVALGITFPVLLAVWGVIWLSATVLLLRVGSLRDVAIIIAWGVGVILIALLLWRFRPHGDAAGKKAAAPPLFLLCLAEQRRLTEGEDHDFFAGYGADIVVQAQHPDASYLLDLRLDDRPRSFHHLDSHLLLEIASLLGLVRLGQMLFRRSQNPLEPDQQQITDQVGVDVLGAAAHALLRKTGHPLADGRFDFSRRLHHRNLSHAAVSVAGQKGRQSVPENQTAVSVTAS